ncbi:hypothetical protein [Legionella micdadei]|uniref:hypothetical protein n=1 Tax=Legionella micdadei TaxID=451 RepID=UPI0020A4AE7B|nr:hypothetical protein [Legionella micdadei]
MNHQCLLRRKLNNEEELLEQCRLIEGLSFAQLADFLQIAIPAEKHRRKGWAGTALNLPWAPLLEQNPYLILRNWVLSLKLCL